LLAAWNHGAGDFLERGIRFFQAKTRKNIVWRQESAVKAKKQGTTGKSEVRRGKSLFEAVEQ